MIWIQFANKTTFQDREYLMRSISMSLPNALLTHFRQPERLNSCFPECQISGIPLFNPNV